MLTIISGPIEESMDEFGPKWIEFGPNVCDYINVGLYTFIQYNIYRAYDVCFLMLTILSIDMKTSNKSNR